MKANALSVDIDRLPWKRLEHSRWPSHEGIYLFTGPDEFYIFNVEVSELFPDLLSGHKQQSSVFVTRHPTAISQSECFL